MRKLILKFPPPYAVQRRYKTEKSLRHCRADFAALTHALFDDLPMTQPANERRLQHARGKYRKDNFYPSESHEQRHIWNALNLLKKFKFITPVFAKVHGSADAFLTGLTHHDTPEDGIASEGELEHYLLRKNPRLNRRDLRQAFFVVSSMTRKGNTKALPERDKQMQQLLLHPYAFIGKQIDWCDKLATMIGVAHFESDDQKGIIKVLKETARYFLDSEQHYAQKAMQKYPFAKDVIAAMDAVMGLQYEMLLHYVHAMPGNEDFKREFKPGSLDRFLPQAMKTLVGLPRGVHYVYNIIDRMDGAATRDPGNSSLSNVVKTIKADIAQAEKTVLKVPRLAP